MLAETCALPPWLGMGDAGNLLLDPHRSVPEEVAEPNEPADFVNVERFAARHLPEPDDIERQPRIVPVATTTVTRSRAD